jgi:hypothetical protein
MCSGLVAMKVWMRQALAPFSASAARLMSRSLARASEQTTESLMTSAMALMASKSPLDDLHALELASDAQLFLAGHGGAGRLLAIAQGGVENDQLVGHGGLLARWWGKR